MKKILSVSRRTDIPAFYGEWFLCRLEHGFAGWENPFGGQKYRVSLKREDVSGFVFWSKNYRPFLNALEKVKSLGYPAMFNYTITGLPNEYECNLVTPEEAIESLKIIADMYSPEHINWRYDPIVTSQHTNETYHLDRFAWLSDQLKGYVKRCYFSYAIMYGKVQRNFAKFEKKHQAGFFEMEKSQQIELAGKLADIALSFGIQLFTCCGDFLINDKILKAHCVDGKILAELYPNECEEGLLRATRKECGCTESTDIGKYDTCPHGCIYCYANVNKEAAEKSYADHDSHSAFLGFSKTESENFLDEISNKKSSVLKKTKPLTKMKANPQVQQKMFNTDI